MDSSNEINQIKKIPSFHLVDLDAMLNYSEFYEDYIIEITVADNTYELQDFYCKKTDCDCVSTRFNILQDGEEIGKIWYDYEKGGLMEPSDFGFIIEQFKASEEITDHQFNTFLKDRHAIIKNTFEILKLKTEHSKLDKELVALRKQNNLFQRPLKKIGRNEPCPCRSGKKYKKCCL